MFTRRENRHLPKHINKYTLVKGTRLTEEDKKQIQDFYKKHNINYRGLTDSHQSVTVKRTINYIYIVAHFIGKDAVKGIVRIQAYVFHKSGRILYDLDHDYQEHPKDTFGHSQTKHQKCLKLNYDLHDELNNKELKEVGKNCRSFIAFDKACHNLLKEDNTLQSIDFITQDCD